LSLDIPAAQADLEAPAAWFGDFKHKQNHRHRKSALGYRTPVVAPDAINAGKPLGDMPVEIVDVAADDNSQQVVATEYAKLNVDDVITSPQDARDAVRAYSELGFDRLLFLPAVASLDQVDRLADAVL